MAIQESQLDTWSHQGSVQQSSDTYATVKRALEANDTKYANKSRDVFLQGSYGNDTNIYSESDVDIVIRTDSIYYYDTSALNPQELQSFYSSFTAATYTYAEYKSQVVQALQKSFGQNDVKPGEKAVKIKASGNRRSSDVVVATEFRRYYSGPLGLAYVPGICFFTSAEAQISNYPKQHSANLTTKHQATYQWFKPMVRILKNMRSKLVDDGVLAAGSAPSYFIEGLLYNVPNDKFGKSYGDSFVAAVNWILTADRTKFVTPSEQHYLARDGFAECWPCSNCNNFIDEIVKLWNGWN
jgi:Second Messenger Oligonucleotide or Dinucleotide Synthetase domain